MKATLKQILEGNQAIQQLLAAKLPVKASYAVSKLAKACAGEMEDYQKKREKIFEEAGCVVKDDKYTHPEGQDKVEAAAKTAAELLDVTVEFNAIALDLDHFGNADVPGSAFFGLEWAMKAE